MLNRNTSNILTDATSENNIFIALLTWYPTLLLILEQNAIAKITWLGFSWICLPNKNKPAMLKKVAKLVRSISCNKFIELIRFIRNCCLISWLK